MRMRPGPPPALLGTAGGLVLPTGCAASPGRPGSEGVHLTFERVGLPCTRFSVDLRKPGESAFSHDTDTVLQTLSVLQVKLGHFWLLRRRLRGERTGRSREQVGSAPERMVSQDHTSGGRVRVRPPARRPHIPSCTSAFHLYLLTRCTHIRPLRVSRAWPGLPGVCAQWPVLP